MLQKLAVVLLALLAFNTTKSFAAAGDTTVVHVFQNQHIITNPNTGSNPYSHWGYFQAQQLPTTR